MAMRCGLFDSTQTVEIVGGFPRGDKAETADFFAEYFSSFVGNGIYINPPTSFQVLPQSGRTVRIRPGKCFIKGYFAFDDAPEDKTFPADGKSHEQWLVLRLDLADGSIKKVWITDPAPGALPVRNEVIYDLVVARVSVGAGVATITDSMITDLRADPNYCGRVKSLVDGIGQTVEYADVAGMLEESARSQLLSRSGDTMTGPLTLHGDPTDGLHAASKRYVDARSPQLVELVRFTSSGVFSPANYPSVGNRYLIMLLGAGGGSFRNSSGNYRRAGGAGAMQFVDFYYPPNSPQTSFNVVVGAASRDSDGGATSFWCFTAPGGKKPQNETVWGQGGSVAEFTGEAGSSSGGGNSLYGTGATASSNATGYGGGSYESNAGGNGLCIVYGYI